VVTPVAFCGLGLMGGPMARRLLAAGVPVTVWNRSQDRSRELARLGATVAASPAEAAGRAGAAIAMLATPAAVHEVVFGPDGLASGATRPDVLIQMSTVAQRDVLAIRRRLPVDVDLLDAPVLGSGPQAAAGELRILAGGDAEVVERCRPLLAPLGEVVHVGPIGAGSALKQVVNAAVAPMVALLAEAVALGTRLGLDQRLLLDELERSRVGPLVRRKRGRIERGRYPADVRLATFRKDMRLVEEAGRECGVPMRLAAAAGRLADEAIEHGLGDRDYSILVAHAGAEATGCG
jgi:3-hydroxyisobutyrate dehydrogenase-like beta-hydroxyacid dehydrogenase